MTTLARAVAIGDNELVIDAPAGWVFPRHVKIDSELLSVGGEQYKDRTTLVLSRPAQAAHDNGATVTDAGRPFDAAFLAASGGGGSGVTVDNQVDDPAEVTTIVAPGATLEDGSATLPVVILKATATLTDAQIKALPTTPVEIVAATETLDYSGLPTQLLVPIYAHILAHNGTTYTNLDDDPVPTLQLVVGSDWSLSAMAVTNAGVADATAYFSVGTQFSRLTATGADLNDITALENSLQDNGLFLAASNGGNGDFTGGDAANSWDVTVLYAVVDV